jgi:prepilin-type N-terminal cleavage/methylation domain-containing protein
MLTAVRTRLGTARPAEHGFTLVELLVSMAAGLVVLFGLVSIMIVTLHQTQRTFTTVDATRRARTALANIENELHSACIAGQAPIEGVTAGGVTESDASDLVFLSYFGDVANPTPIWHQLTFNSTAGTLIDTTYNVTGTAPDWTQGTLIARTTLLTNVSQLGTTPVFQYYAYTAEYTDSAGNVYWIIPDGTNAVPITGTVPASAPLSTSSGLSASDAGNTVEVVINMSVGASGGLSNTSLTAVNDPVTDSISLRLTTPPDYVQSGATQAGYGPCQ